MQSNSSIKKRLSFLVVLILLMQVFSPLINSIVIAVVNNDNGSITLRQTIDKINGVNPNGDFHVKPNEEVHVKVEYSASSNKYHFQNVQISYTIPEGFDYVGIDVSSHIEGVPSYDSGSRTVNLNLANSHDSVLKNGTVGEFIVKIKSQKPSLYPHGKVITFNSVQALGDIVELDVNDNIINGIGTGYYWYSEKPFVTFFVGQSWNITKNGPNTVIIPKDKNITYLDVDYTIGFNNGNIDLKNVVIEDTLPIADAEIISSKISSNDFTYAKEGNKVTWNIAKILANTPLSIDVKVRYPIASRNGGIGVSSGKYTNTVSVKEAYPIDGDGIGSKKVVFLSGTATKTTSFVDSTAYWGVYRYDKSSGVSHKKVVITPDTSVTIAEVTYEVGVSDTGVGNVDLGDAELVEKLDPQAVYKSSSHGGGYDPDTHSVKWSLIDVKLGENPRRTVVVEYTIARDSNENVGVTIGDKAYNEVSLTKAVGNNQNVTINYSPTTLETHFIAPEDWWYITKTSSNNVTIHSKDGQTSEVTYTIQIKATNNGKDNFDLDTIDIVDTLPSKAIFVSASDGGIHTGADDGYGGTVTWNLSNLPKENVKTLTVEVKFDVAENIGNKGVRPNDTSTNSVEITGYTPSIAIVNGKTDSHTTTFKKATEPNPYFEKGIDGYNKNSGNVLIGSKHFDIGDTFDYTLDFNNGNSSKYIMKEATIIDDNLSSKIDYSSLYLGHSSYSVNYYLYYKTDGGWIQHLTQFNTDTEQTITLNSLIGTDKLTGIKLVYTDVPVNFNFYNKIKLTGTINNTASHDDIIDKSAQLEYKYDAFNGEEVKSKSDSVRFKILLNTPWIYEVKKEKLTGNASTKHDPESNVSFKLSVKNHPSYATGVFNKPVLIDIVPEGFEYVNGTTLATFAGSDEVITPTFIENYKGDGKGLLVWKFNNDLPIGKNIELTYDLKIDKYALAGKHTNEFYLSGLGMAWGKLNLAYINSAISANLIPKIFTDSENIDNDTNTSNYIEGQHSNVSVKEVSAIKSDKYVKGNRDSDYSTFPSYGETTPGGSAEYKLEILNDGNVYLPQIEIIDILPFIGDTAVLNENSPRDSKWRPYLIKELIGGDQEIVLDINGNKQNATVKVWYSVASDPIRNSNSGQIGSQNPNWSKTPPEDITTIQSLKLLISDFRTKTDTLQGLEPGSIVTVKWDMRSPVEAPINSDVAWNSISMKATKLDNEGNTSNTLYTEPSQVGIKVTSNLLGEIGNFVWFDKNGNGIQDDGYDNESAGLNDIRVKLYNEANTLIDETVTGPKHNDDNNSKGIGAPGYYSFPNLPQGKYKVEFLIPDYYTLTTKGSGSDSNIDSDGATTQSPVGGYIPVKTELITLGENEKRLDIDLGIIPSDTGSASIKLTKEAYRFKKLDNTYKNFTDKNNPLLPVNVGETITYKITLENDGTVPLHNIILEDELNGFKFTTTGSRIKNLSDTSLKLDKLDSKEVYVVYGTYTALETDLSNPIKNTVKVWVNELNEEEKSAKNYAEQDDVTVHVAGIELNKEVSAVKYKGQATFTPVTDQNIKIELGDTIKYKITVNNNGNIDLTDIKINDSKAGLVNHAVTVDKNSSQYVEVDYVVTESDLPELIQNTATATHEHIRYVANDISDVYIVANIGDTIWYDLNENGKKDTGENGIKDVKVELYKDNVKVKETITNNDGYYLFDRLPKGNYTVKVVTSTLPSGLKQVYALDSNKDNETTIALEGKNIYTLDFGYNHTATVGDYVWFDEDGDKIQDNNESPLKGVKLNLKDSLGNIIKTTTTDSNGKYIFEKLPGGKYIISVDEATIPSELKVIYELDDNLDNTVSFTLSPGENKKDVDFGYVNAGIIGDTVWYDLNKNGLVDNDEKGIENVTINLKDYNGKKWSTTTNNLGIYTFDKLISGEYTITLDESTLPKDLILTYNLDNVKDNKTTITLAPRESNLNVDFGYRVNNPPVVIDYEEKTMKYTPVDGTVVGSDIDEDKLIYSKDSDPKNGKVIVNNDGTWTYTPDRHYVGEDTFTVLVTDEYGKTTISTIKIIVKDDFIVSYEIDLVANPDVIVGNGKSQSVLTAKITDNLGNPAKNVEVTFNAQKGTFPEGSITTTDENGYAKVIYKSEKISGIVPIVIPVVAEVRDNVRDLNAKDSINVTFEPASIYGVVVDNNTGKPVEGATVKVEKDFDNDGVIDFTTTYKTGADGAYKIFIPEGDVMYDIYITKPILVGEEYVDFTFKQENKVDELTGKGNENFDSDKTASGVLLIKKPDGDINLLDSLDDYEIDVFDENENEVNGVESSLDENGVFNAQGLSKNTTYEIVVKKEVKPGVKIILGTVDVTINDDGEMNISEILIDPYGTITDSVTKEIIEGADVKLYYADSPRNIAAGITPHTLVELPIFEFPPNDNINPQFSDEFGQYAWMVFPNTDYYIVANKTGYKEYTSPMISVYLEIVRHDFEMEPTNVESEDSKETNPKTGHNNNLYNYLLALISIVLIYVTKRKFRNNKA